jgi:DNA-binding response OmpR family regulator
MREDMQQNIDTLISQLTRILADSESALAVSLDKLVAVMRVADTDEVHESSRLIPIVVLIPESKLKDGVAGHKIGRRTTHDSSVGVAKVLGIDDRKWKLKTFQSNASINFSDVTVNLSAMEVYRNGLPVPLTRLEFETLKYVVRNEGRVISRDELLNEVWGYQNYPCTRTVDNIILKLRQKLEPDPANPVYFETVFSVGYRFRLQPRHLSRSRVSFSSRRSRVDPEAAKSKLMTIPA